MLAMPEMVAIPEATPQGPIGAHPGMPPSPKPWVLYLLECKGERLYAGITNDLAARFKAHVAGRGAHFTRGFPPVRIMAACELASRSDALKAEYALKQQPREKKLAFLGASGTAIDFADVPGQPSDVDDGGDLVAERQRG
jgi:putative endonuclease